jgi:hypothetical protein
VTWSRVTGVSVHDVRNERNAFIFTKILLEPLNPWRRRQCFHSKRRKPISRWRCIASLKENHGRENIKSCKKFFSQLLTKKMEYFFDCGWSKMAACYPKRVGLTYSKSVVRDSSVGTVTRHGLDCPRIESRWGRDNPHPSKPCLGPTQPPIRRIPGIFAGCKASGVNHPPTTSAEVKERVELYVYSPSGPSWPVIGLLLPSYLLSGVKLTACI